MPMTQGAIDTPTAEQAVDGALANDHAVHDVDDVALEVDDDAALDVAQRRLQTKHTLQVGEEVSEFRSLWIPTTGLGSWRNSRC